MPRSIPPPLAFCLTTLRVDAGWSQGELARANGISQALLCLYESGKKKLKRQRLEALVAPLGAGPDKVEETLLYVETLRGEASEPTGSPFELSPSERRQLRRDAAAVARHALASTLEVLARTRRETLVGRVRSQAEVSWRRLSRFPPASRRVLVAGADEYRSWGVCELACEASVRAAADAAPPALELAELALAIAERVPGGELWRARVQGYAWAFVGNARRVGNDLLGAHKAFATARRLWEAGAPADPGVLDASRVLDLEASLRRDQRRWSEALALLDQALQVSPSAERTGHILLTKASILEQWGHCEAAIDALTKAAPLVDRRRDPRQAFALCFNFATNLCQLERHAQAAPLVVESRDLAVALRNDLDLVRVLWLEAKVAAGLGRRTEALAALRQVRRDFTTRKLAADAALVTLNLAVLLLEDGRTGEVRELASEAVPIFGSLGIGRDALAAVRVFWQAAEQEAATAKRGRLLLAFLERARYDPELRFDVYAASRQHGLRP